MQLLEVRPGILGTGEEFRYPITYELTDLVRDMGPCFGPEGLDYQMAALDGEPLTLPKH